MVTLITVKCVSPEKVLEWAENSLLNGRTVGEITLPETLNYKTLKPRVGGLFCQEVFGTVKPGTCECKRPYSKIPLTLVKDSSLKKLDPTFFYSLMATYDKREPVRMPSRPGRHYEKLHQTFHVSSEPEQHRIREFQERMIQTNLGPDDIVVPPPLQKAPIPRISYKKDPRISYKKDPRISYQKDSSEKRTQGMKFLVEKQGKNKAPLRYPLKAPRRVPLQSFEKPVSYIDYMLKDMDVNLNVLENPGSFPKKTPHISYEKEPRGFTKNPLSDAVRSQESEKASPQSMSEKASPHSMSEKASPHTMSEKDSLDSMSEKDSPRVMSGYGTTFSTGMRGLTEQYMNIFFLLPQENTASKRSHNQKPGRQKKKRKVQYEVLRTTVKGQGTTDSPKYIDEPDGRCVRCGVFYQSSQRRRYQIGYVDLLMPCAHIWYVKNRPSFLAILLDVPQDVLHKIVYFQRGFISQPNYCLGMGDLWKGYTLQKTYSFIFGQWGFDDVPAPWNKNQVRFELSLNDFGALSISRYLKAIHVKEEIRDLQHFLERQNTRKDWTSAENTTFSSYRSMQALYSKPPKFNKKRDEDKIKISDEIFFYHLRRQHPFCIFDQSFFQQGIYHKDGVSINVKETMPLFERHELTPFRSSLLYPCAKDFFSRKIEKARLIKNKEKIEKRRQVDYTILENWILQRFLSKRKRITPGLDPSFFHTDRIQKALRRYNIFQPGDDVNAVGQSTFGRQHRGTAFSNTMRKSTKYRFLELVHVWMVFHIGVRKSYLLNYSNRVTMERARERKDFRFDAMTFTEQDVLHFSYEWAKLQTFSRKRTYKPLLTAQRGYLEQGVWMEHQYRLLRRYKILQRFTLTSSKDKEKGTSYKEIKLTDLCVTLLPVIPPTLRPLMEMTSGLMVSSDLNDFYILLLRRRRNFRLMIGKSNVIPLRVIADSYSLVQQSVDMLFENGRVGRMERKMYQSVRLMKSLTDFIKGKPGRFRHNLLGKRVDYSARSVIIVGPSLQLSQCGLPKEIALKLFYPHFLRYLIQSRRARSIFEAKDFVRKYSKESYNSLYVSPYYDPSKPVRASDFMTNHAVDRPPHRRESSLKASLSSSSTQQHPQSASRFSALPPLRTLEFESMREEVEVEPEKPPKREIPGICVFPPDDEEDEKDDERFSSPSNEFGERDSAFDPQRFSIHTGEESLISTKERDYHAFWELFQKCIAKHPILLNRAPTLHRLGVQAFFPVLMPGRAIRLHPLVCPSFNADFDGDQMGIHVPLSIQAQAEAVFLMSATHNWFSPATGDPNLLPSQDMVLGFYYATAETTAQTATPRFHEPAAVLDAYAKHQLLIHSSVWLQVDHDVSVHGTTQCEETDEILVMRTGRSRHVSSSLAVLKDPWQRVYKQWVRTTPGRVLFNDVIEKSCMSAV